MFQQSSEAKKIVVVRKPPEKPSGAPNPDLLQTLNAEREQLKVANAKLAAEVDRLTQELQKYTSTRPVRGPNWRL